MDNLKTLSEKARQLSVDLRSKNIVGYSGTGVRTLIPEIIVYVSEITDQVRSSVPRIWQDVPVKVQQTGVPELL